MKKNGETTNKFIVDIYNQIKTGELQTRPYYQRRLVWTAKDKEDFIETILNGYPFPEIYECQGVIDTITIKTIYYIVDGQQRITTIRDYIEGNLKLDHLPLYSDLKEEERELFLNYPVVVRQLGAISDEDIKTIFDKLNKTDYTLNSTELIYAQYQGAFISLARKQADKQSSFFEKLLGEKSISRMADIGFILQIMATIENGIYFSGDKEVESFVNMYNETYENKNQMEELLNKSFDEYLRLNLPFDSLFYKKAASFSLIVELCKCGTMFTLCNLKKNIIEFEKMLLDNKTKDDVDNDFVTFYRYLYQGTASKKARDVRGKMIRKYVLGLTE